MIIAQTIALGLAVLADLFIPDPDFALHPVRIIGAVISLFERLFRAVFPKSKTGERVGGLFTVIFVILICGGAVFAGLFLAYRLNIVLGAAIEAVLCYFFLAAASLKKSSMRVYYALMSGDIEGARKAVSIIVGRDTASLDDVGITKAAVETVAENTSDGITAPLMYMTLGGAVLGCLYKAVNTMDSMLGYKNDRYINFGAAAAKLDDAANYIPSRITARLMIFASRLLGFDGDNASYIYHRDARKHASPNSAQTESVMAGALRIRLAGDAYYFGELYEKPYIGDAVKDVQYADIKDANRIMYLTSVLTSVICIAARIVVLAVIYFIRGLA